MAAQRCFVAGLVLAIGLAGCAQLRAERPLFSVADQAGAAPLTEGIWITVSDECPERYARTRGRFPKACTPIELRRAEDGAWRVTLRADLAYGLTEEERANAEADSGARRLIIAPAVERTIDAQSFAPLYVGELHPDNAEDSVGYLVLAPTGELPATAFFAVLSIGCESILRDGPIEGITPGYNTRIAPDGSEHRELTDCVAETRAAVREAARRTVVENVADMTRERYVCVRP